MELFLDHIDQNNIPVQGTAIGDAIRLANKSLVESSDSSVQKAIILITDGEDHESGPLDAARQAASENIKIYPIGMGSDGGAPIPLAEGGFVKDRSGQMVMSRLDEGTLSRWRRSPVVPMSVLHRGTWT